MEEGLAYCLLKWALQNLHSVFIDAIKSTSQFHRWSSWFSGIELYLVIFVTMVLLQAL
jgi:hypothetical protein